MDMLQSTQPLPCPCESPEPPETSPVLEQTSEQEPGKPREEQQPLPAFIAPDDLPIRPMKPEQQRQLMVLLGSDDYLSRTILQVAPMKVRKETQGALGVPS